jgi:hypothetical protein
MQKVNKQKAGYMAKRVKEPSTWAGAAAVAAAIAPFLPPPWNIVLTAGAAGAGALAGVLPEQGASGG